MNKIHYHSLILTCSATLTYSYKGRRLVTCFQTWESWSDCTIIWNFQKMFKNNTWLWQNTRTKASKCRPDNDHPSQKIRLPIIWKHVLNDSSKTVETFPSKMAELLHVTITTEFNVFTSECHFNANIWAEKKNGKQNDF